MHQQLVNGIVIGSVYGLIAIGYTMVYGVLQLINFAFGEIYMVGAFIALAVLTLLGVAATTSGMWTIGALLLALLAAMAGAAILGALVERVAYRPLRNAPRLAALITALGVSIVLQNTMMLLTRAEQKVFPAILPEEPLQIGGAVVTPTQLSVVSLAILLMAALHLFVTKTRMGRAMRALAQDRYAASLMGVSTNHTIALTFFIGSALGAAAGVLVGMLYGVVDFYMGYLAGLKAFTAAVLGGIGNIRGAMLGGVVLGVVESFGAGVLPMGAEWKDVIAFALLILILVFRPSGLLGEQVGG